MRPFAGMIGHEVVAKPSRIKAQPSGTLLMPYFPPAGPDWERSASETAAFAPAGAYAAEHETPWKRDLAYMIANDFGEVPPWNEALGPVRPRGAHNGLLLHGGK